MKKDFTLEGHESGAQEAGETTTEATTTTINQTRLSKPANTVVAFPENTTNTRNQQYSIAAKQKKLN